MRHVVDIFSLVYIQHIFLAYTLKRLYADRYSFRDIIFSFYEFDVKVNRKVQSSKQYLEGPDFS